EEEAGLGRGGGAREGRGSGAEPVPGGGPRIMVDAEVHLLDQPRDPAPGLGQRHGRRETGRARHELGPELAAEVPADPAEQGEEFGAVSQTRRAPIELLAREDAERAVLWRDVVVVETRADDDDLGCKIERLEEPHLGNGSV